MEETNNNKSYVIFKLTFTTSKLLAYIIVVVGSTVGLLLKSTEVVIVGFTVAAALSGAKSVTDNMRKIRGGRNPNDNSYEHDDYDEPIPGRGYNKNKREFL